MTLKYIKPAQQVSLVGKFLYDESGATAVEYGLIITSLSLLVIGGISGAFDAIEALFVDNNSQINTAFN